MIRRPDYRPVKATPAEVEAYLAKRPGAKQPAVPRAEHACGARIWYSGLAIGSHEKACPLRSQPWRNMLPVGYVEHRGRWVPAMTRQV